METELQQREPNIKVGNRPTIRKAATKLFIRILIWLAGILLSLAPLLAQRCISAFLKDGCISSTVFISCIKNGELIWLSVPLLVLALFEMFYHNQKNPKTLNVVLMIIALFTIVLVLLSYSVVSSSGNNSYNEFRILDLSVVVFISSVLISLFLVINTVEVK